MEYISREEILAEYDRQHKGPAGGARKIMETWPAADVAPVRRGKWKTVMCDDGYGEYTLFECDQCGNQSAQKRNYCSNCGAKMDGD